MTDTVANSPAAKRPRRMARELKPIANEAALPFGPDVTTPETDSHPPGKQKSKATLVLNLLQRSEGATLDQLVAATGWLPHTTRAALTGLKKKGHVITSEKPAEGSRVYRITGRADATQ